MVAESDIIKLDRMDRKILAELDRNSREPVSRIAKKLGVGRIVVNYRMKQLEKKGVIKNYSGLADPYRFGLASWKTYIKFQSLTKESEDEVIRYLNKVPNLWWIIKTTGAYDLMFCVLAKNNYHYYKTLIEFQKRFNRLVYNIATTNHIDSRWFTRNYLTGEQGDYIGEVFTTEPEITKLDRLDMKILKVVAENAREPSTDIASKTGSTAKAVGYRLKELKKKGVIVNYRLNMDVKRFGYNFYKVFLSLKDFKAKDLTKLDEFFRKHPNIVEKSNSYGPWDMEFELEVENQGKFNDIMREMRETFPEIIKKYDYIQITEEIRQDNNFIKHMGL